MKHRERTKYYVVPETMQPPYRPLRYAMKPANAIVIAKELSRRERVKYKVVISADADPLWSAEDIANLRELPVAATSK